MMHLAKFITLNLPILISVAFMTLLERKVLGIIGFRVGPNKVSLSGFLQPISDALKLSNKQLNYLSNFSMLFYNLSSFFMLGSALTLWSCVFSEPSPLIYKFSLLIILLVLGFNSLNSILAGWSTFSKYSLIGSIRTVAQLISYEAVLYMIFFFFIYQYVSFNLYNLNFYFMEVILITSPIFFMAWLPTMLAELNRTPFDFSEGESELVSGFNTEFGSACFTLIFLSEYSNIIFFSMLSSFIFFYYKMMSFFFVYFFFIIWVRSVLPRFRYDKLMMLAWKFLLPLTTAIYLMNMVYAM